MNEDETISLLAYKAHLFHRSFPR